MFHPGVHRSVVHIYNSIALFTVGLKDGFLHVPGCILCRDNIRDFEKCRLEHGICTAAQSPACGNLNGVDDIKVDFFIRYGFSHVCGKMAVQILLLPVTCNQQVPAFLQIRYNVIFVNVRLVMAGHKIRLVHQVGAADG